MENKQTKQKGNFAEKQAISFLEDCAYSIIETNFYAKKLGEIDIIAKKDDVYHFCEVKSTDTYETAVNNLNSSKLSKLKRSVEYYIQLKQLDCAYCIDGIIISNNEIEFLENITI